MPVSPLRPLTLQVLSILLLLAGTGCDQAGSASGNTATYDGVTVTVPAGGKLLYHGGPGWAGGADMLYFRWDRTTGPLTGFRMVVDDSGRVQAHEMELLASDAAQYNVKNKGWSAAADFEPTEARGKYWYKATSSGNPRPVVAGSTEMAIYTRLADTQGGSRLLWAYFDYAPGDGAAAWKEAEGVLATIKVKGEK